MIMQPTVSELVADKVPYIWIGDDWNNPIYTPHTTQWPFHLDGGYLLPQPLKWKYRALFGGTGSGKTRAGLAEDIYWCLKCPGIVGYLFEPTYKMIDRIIFPLLNLMLGTPFYENPLIKSFTRQRMNIVWNTSPQSVLWFVSLDDPEQAEGGNIDFAHVDEARLVKPPERFDEAWHVISRRLRGSGRGHPIGAWVTTTPPKSKTHPLYMFFEHGKEKDPDAKSYRMRLDDNVENLPRGYIESQKRQHSGSAYDRFIEGLFAEDERVTFDFEYGVHVGKFRKPEFGDMAYGVDFGWTNECAVLAVMFDGDRRAFVLDEVYETRLSTANVIDRCFELQKKWGKGTFWCDASAPADIDAMKRAGLKVKPGVRHSGAKEEGVREIGGRLEDAGDGMRRLYVSPNCVNTIDELQSYDIEKKMHDHAVDALRYCLVGGGRKRETAWGLGSFERRRR